MQSLEDLQLRIKKLQRQDIGEASKRYERISEAVLVNKEVKNWLRDLIKLLEFLKQRGV